MKKGKLRIPGQFGTSSSLEEFDQARATHAFTSWALKEAEKELAKVRSDAELGFRIRRGGETGRANRKSMTELRAMNACLEVYRKQPRWKLGAVRKEAASRLGVSLRTIEERTKDLRQRIASLKKARQHS